MVRHLTLNIEGLKAFVRRPTNEFHIGLTRGHEMTYVLDSKWDTIWKVEGQ